MRINRFVADATGMSRRAADAAITQGRVSIDGKEATVGMQTELSNHITLDGKTLTPSESTRVVLLNKPVGYVCSRAGQGSKTIYELLPADYRYLKPVGRLDKDSSGLLLLTNDGALAHQLTHPSFRKTKIYEVSLDKPLAALHRQMISDIGVQLQDGPSKLQLERLREGDDTAWRVTMHEGRNRQIRRTFAALGYQVTTLHRTHFGVYSLGDTVPGGAKVIN